MNYILYGVQALMIKNRLNHMLKERLETIDDFNCVRFDARETPVQDIVYECTLLPMGYDRKAVIVDNAFFLAKNGEKEIKGLNQDYKTLVMYLQNPNEQTDLFLCVNVPAIDEKSELVKIIAQVKGAVFSMTDITKDQWPPYVRTYFGKLGVEIDGDAVSELIGRCQGDATRFGNEANKLALYTSHVRLSDIETMINKPLDENAFAISNALLKGKSDVALGIFRDLRVQNEEPIRLISLLANQFRLMAECQFLASQDLEISEIARTLSVNEYRVKLALDAKHQFPAIRLLKYLDKLYELDYKIKSGQIDRFYAFEMFLAEF